MKFNVIRDLGVAVCFLLLMLLIAMKVDADAARSFTGGYRVADGDSLAHGDMRLRLEGIDAPELRQSCTRGGTRWKCGEAARQALLALVDGKPVECKGSRSDKYRRLLVTCRAGALNINREMVLSGMAVAFGAYEDEQETARAARIGLWSGDFAVPRDWRREHRAGFEDEGPHLPSFFRRLFGIE